MIPKRLNDLPGGQFLRHETQFDEGAHAVLQQAIVNVVHVRKIVNRVAAGVLVVETHFVMKDRVKPDVLEPVA